MTCAFQSAPLPNIVFRVARGDYAWALPDWAYAHDGIFQERFDDPLGQFRTLYAASSRFGAFVEVLDGRRPRPGRGPARLDRDWLERRCIGDARLVGDYADLTTGHAMLEIEGGLGPQLEGLGILKVDISTMTSRERHHMEFTREVSRHVFDCTTEGHRKFAGIHYISRPAPEVRNWAIFERADARGFNPGTSMPLRQDDPDLQAALSLLNIELAS